MSCFLFVDTETTGLNHTIYDPIEIAGLIYINDKRVDEFCYRVRPVKIEMEIIYFTTKNKRVLKYQSKDIIPIQLKTGKTIRVMAGDLKHLEKFSIYFGNGYSQEIEGGETRLEKVMAWPTPEKEALRVHGMSEREIEGFQDPNVAFNKILKKLKKYRQEEEKFICVGHNVEFDKNHILHWAYRLGRFEIEGLIEKNLYVCTLNMARYLYARKIIDCNKLSLKALCKHFGIELTNAHSALHDINATAELFFKLESLMGKDKSPQAVFGIQQSLI